ncbi:MAG: hypothetical protein IPM38_16995 [Ignavibacteria bacterium]|nr:hypothetical protein [Ignavibacteria bacterium]
MKKLKSILVVSVIFYVSVALYTGCETSITKIVPYSGNWNFSFSSSNGTTLSNATVSIQDTGDFCKQFTVIGSGVVFFVQGDVDGNGQITGGFSNSCSGPVSGNISGTFTELMGAGYGAGTFTDTLQNPAFKGTWEARRN